MLCVVLLASRRPPVPVLLLNMFTARRAAASEVRQLWPAAASARAPLGSLLDSVLTFKRQKRQQLELELQQPRRHFMQMLAEHATRRHKPTSVCAGSC
jgi:hypothetical protein